MRFQEQVVVDFGGLEFEWMPIRANEKYEKWLEDNVVIRQHVRGSAFQTSGSRKSNLHASLL